MAIILFAVPQGLLADFVICQESGIQIEPAIGFDSTNYLVVWNDVRATLSSLYGTRVTQGGTVLDSGGVQLLYENDNQTHPALAFDGNNYLVAWQFGC